MQDWAIAKEEMETLLNIEDEEVVEGVKSKKTKGNEDFDSELCEDYEITICIKEDLHDVLDYSELRKDKLKNNIEQCSRSFYIPNTVNKDELWIGYAYKYNNNSIFEKLLGKTLNIKIALHNKGNTESEIIIDDDYIICNLSYHFWQQNPKQHSMIYLIMQKKSK